jgi:hypothetical protein
MNLQVVFPPPGDHTSFLMNPVGTEWIGRSRECLQNDDEGVYGDKLHKSAMCRRANSLRDAIFILSLL